VLKIRPANRIVPTNNARDMQLSEVAVVVSISLHPFEARRLIGCALSTYQLRRQEVSKLVAHVRNRAGRSRDWIKVKNRKYPAMHRDARKEFSK
jgi:hypothetical protein